MAQLSQQEKLLVAASKLADAESSVFSAEDLVVAAWREYPETFGLQGYPEHPDSNRVFTKIMGKRGLRGKGWLSKVGQKKYKLTESGRHLAQALAAKDDSQEERSESKVRISRGEREILARLLRSRARNKAAQGQRDDLVFHDAAEYWDISARSKAPTFYANFGDTERALESARQALDEESLDSISIGDHTLDEGSLAELFEVHELLQEVFADQLDIIRNRTDERS